MLNYFLSNVPSFLRVDGKFLGVVSENLKIFESNSRLNFLEFLPKDDLFYSIYGDKNCDSMRVFKVDNGLLYYPVFLRKKNLPLKLILQKSESCLFGEILITLVTDGDVKAFIDGFISDVKTLPFLPKNVEIKVLEKHVAVIFTSGKTALLLYDINIRKLVYSDVVDLVEFSDVLSVEKSYKTITKTTIKETWSLSNEIRLLSKESIIKKPYGLICKNLLPLAFFENASLGADLKEIVTPSFYEKSANLKSFLGSVINAVQSPVNEGEVWLIENNLVTKGKLQTKGDLIDNVILDDF